MRVKVMKEAGYEEALEGLALSYNSKPSSRVALALCKKDGGHNKFLESMVIWVDIEAPRYWWSQFDTYRVGVTKQSESTMHTLQRAPLSQSSFEYPVSLETLKELEDCKHSLVELKNRLPEGFLQRRIVCMNYKSLLNMYRQRKDHKLQEWSLFLEAMLNQVEHGEFIWE